MKLFGSLTSPYVRKARMLVKEKQLPVEFFALESAADPRVAALNPIGKVPVLQRDDGSTLFDSPVIVEYLDSLKAPALIPAAGEARWQTLRWHALGDGIVDAAVVRTMELRRPAAQQSKDSVSHQEGKIARCLTYAEQHIGDGQWIMEDHLTLADIAIAAALGYVDFRYPHEWKSGHRKLAKWFAAFSARSSFTDTHPPT